MRNVICSVAVAALIPTLAAAQKPSVNLSRMTPGYSYFNRPGSDLAVQAAELDDCVAVVASLDFGSALPSAGILGGMLTAYASNGFFAAGGENCMIVKGWRVVSLPEAEGEVLGALPVRELAERIAPWIGADAPHGEIVRAWGNDAARASTLHDSVLPAHKVDLQLSFKIYGSGARPVPNAPKLARAKIDAKWPKNSLKPSEIFAAPPEAAVIVVRVKGINNQNGNGLLFARMGPERDVPPSLSDHAPDIIDAGTGTLFAKKDGNWFAFAVPPGRWRLSAMGLLDSLALCLGGPAFEAKAGEVVYAGTFDIGSEDIGPNLNLEPAQTFLAGHPGAATVRSAVYTNGARGRCDSDLYYTNMVYALEIKGAPFEPGYSWGSARPSTAP